MITKEWPRQAQHFRNHVNLCMHTMKKVPRSWNSGL
jgi:hypothetical protein